MTIETILVVLIPSTAVAAFIIRYFWKKDICFKLMKKTINDLSKSEEGSHGTHGKLYEKINDLGIRITKLEVKMDLFINHFNIKPK